MPNANLNALSDAQILINLLYSAAHTFEHFNDQISASVCRDMALKIDRYKRWASTAQKQYGESLIRKAEALHLTDIEFMRAHTNIGMLDNTGARHVGIRLITPSEQEQAQSPPIAINTPTVAISPVALLRINALFSAARNAGLQKPKINLNVNGTKIILKPGYYHSAGIYVLDGFNRLHGMITMEGIFNPKPRCTSAIITAIRTFGDDPVRIARAHGQRTGSCCFCCRTLTDGRSVATGYGQTCARNYQLPWGDEALVSGALIPPDQPLVASGAIAVELSDSIMPSRDRGNYLDMQRSTLQSREFVPELIRAIPAPSIFSRAIVPGIPASLQYDDEDDQFRANRGR